MEELKILDPDVLVFSASLALGLYAIPFLISFGVKRFFDMI
jgi:hypothetical protein